MSSTASPVNEAVVEQIPAGSKATFVFEPDGNELHVDAIAASKFPGLTYEVEIDGETRFGPAGIPPTDVDDLTTTHYPRLEAERSVTVTVRNPSQNARSVAAQVRGVER